MVPSLKILDDEEIREIHMDSLRVLERTGVRFDSGEALEILELGGARVDKAEKIARFPAHVIEDALSKCAPSVTLYGRDGSPPIQVGGRRVYFGTVGFGTYTLDWETGRYREVLYRDLEEMVRLADTLENLYFVLPPATPQDVDKSKTDLYEFKGCFLNTRKHLIPQAQGAASVRKMVEIASMWMGGQEELRRTPIFSIIFVITSPLVVRQDIAETIIESARQMVPIYMATGPMGGGNGPATLAGNIALSNAELLSAIVLAKLVNPEVPIIYATWTRTMDLKTGTVAFGAPEFGLLRIGTTQMAQYYGLPSGGGGILCDSKILDVQTGYEKMATAMLPALAGTNIVLGMGLISSENMISLEQLVADDEIVGYVGRILRGMRVDDETLAVDLIEKIGPGGAFIEEEHTFRYFKEELWAPTITDRTMFNAYVSPEEKSVRSRIEKRIRTKLASYRPIEEARKMEREIDAIIEA